jgi:hypothetical protein
VRRQEISELIQESNDMSVSPSRKSARDGIRMASEERREREAAPDRELPVST